MRRLVVTAQPAAANVAPGYYGYLNSRLRNDEVATDAVKNESS